MPTQFLSQRRIQERSAKQNPNTPFYADMRSIRNSLRIFMGMTKANAMPYWDKLLNLYIRNQELLKQGHYTNTPLARKESKMTRDALYLAKEKYVGR